MKQVFAGLLAALGTVLMVLSLVWCFGNLNKPAQVAQLPQGLEQCAQDLETALESGDLQSFQGLLYGQPQLGIEPGDAQTENFWKVFCGGITWEYTGEFSPAASGYTRTATVSVPDIQALAGTIGPRARQILEQTMAAATLREELYDEAGNFRQELMDKALEQAVQEALAAQPQLRQYQGSVRFVSQDGRWQALPDQGLMKAFAPGT